MPSITRVISDIHFRHPASFVRDLEGLSPLLEGVQDVVFNGDSVEMRFLEDREQALRDAATLRALCAQAGVEPTFLTGNHDPTLTETHHLDLAGGRILVTHGDLLFHGISPWSRKAHVLAAAHARELAQGDADDWEHQLRAVKRTMRAVEHLGPKMRHAERGGATLSSFLHEIFPPWRPLLILGCWLKTPDRAGAIAARFRPAAEFVLVGHMHWAGVWRRQGRVVVNTGSFLPFSKALVVDIDEAGGELTVRRVERRGAAFHPGTAVARFAL
jgi:predicted phosphodiesterase